MNFLKNLTRRLSSNDGGNERRQSVVPSDSNKAKPNPQQTAHVGLTPDQLAETLHWLSLY